MSTVRGYGHPRLIELHVLPQLGRARFDTCEPSTSTVSTPTCSSEADPTDVEASTLRRSMKVHIVLRRALRDAERRASIVRNPAELAHAPKRRPLASRSSGCGMQIS